MPTTYDAVAPAGLQQQSPARRRRTLTAVAPTSLLVVAVLSVLVGSRTVGWNALLDTNDPDHAIAAARLARTCVALAAGAALGLAGACLQGLTRNGLADSGILGLNAGAAFGMIGAAVFLGLSSLTAYVWFAFLGAAVATAVVLGVASRVRGGTSPLALVLTGAAVTAGLTSWTSAILLTDQSARDTFRFWAVGTVGGRGYAELLPVLPFLIVGAVLVLASARTLDALALGDDTARALGRQPIRDRAVVLLAVVLLAGGATALAGPIAFVGLVVPHLVRALHGPAHHQVLPLSAVYGAVLVVLADTAGRVVLPPTEVQVGVMVAVVGAPVFIALARRSKVGAL